MVPAVAGLKKQGANNGACLAFLISTPESGIDSVALTYSLLDPIFTVLRPLIAFLTAFVAGVTENLTARGYRESLDAPPDRTCPVDQCCDGTDCDPKVHAHHHTIVQKAIAGMRFTMNDLMQDLAGWFLLGVLLAGAIAVLVPESFVTEHLGSGIVAYLAMLAVSLPMYVCATLSTPIAAALVAKGMAPGAAMVLLLAGPATNMATVTMVGGMLGARTLAIYLLSIVGCTLLAAYGTDMVYAALDISARASAGAAAAELLPRWMEWAATVILAILIARALWAKLSPKVAGMVQSRQTGETLPDAGCSCRHDSTGGT